MASTDDGQVRWSRTLSDWGERAVGRFEISIVFGNGIWLIGERLRTSDFENWDDLGPNGVYGEFLFAYEHFLRIGSNRVIDFSVNGSIWDAYGGPFGINGGVSSGQCSEMTIFQNRVVAVGEDGLISVSAPWRDLFTEWQASHFSETELADFTIAGPDADPDRDGLENAVEYAMRLNPLENEILKNPKLIHGRTTGLRGFDLVESYDGLFGLYLYPRIERRMGVKFTVERSQDLVDWQTGDVITSSFGGESRSYIMLNSTGGHFMRFRAEVIDFDVE